MEQIRVLIAIGLSFLVFLVWDVVFLKKNQEQIVGQNKTIEGSVETNTVKEDLITERKKTEEDDEKSQTFEDNEYQNKKRGFTSKIIRINTSLYSASLDEIGGKISSFTLKNYRENSSIDSPPKELISPTKGKGSGTIFFSDNSDEEKLETTIFRADTERKYFDKIDSELQISLAANTSDGLLIKKIYTFQPKSYLIKLRIEIDNLSDSQVNKSLGLSIGKYLENSKKAYGFVGPSALLDGSRKEIDIDDLEDNIELTGRAEWIGIETIYFLSCIIPEHDNSVTVKPKALENNIIENSLIEQGRNISSGEKATYEYQIYLGPKSLKVLSDLEHGLDKAVNFGFFDIIAKPCLWLMNFIYQYIPNYGIAIIILTVFIKIVLWPLGNKSYKSMNDMKKLQPLVNEIREKYKNDKKKMNQELMELYRVYKVNPMGGCLPMLLQIPVFIAFYRMLYEAIELRHAPFFGWINDLSAPDRLFRFEFAIPLMEPPYGIPVLTLLMGATMFIQQKMSPPPGDPSQAKIMMLMPIIFTVIFINFSSGLVLYWLVNNLLSIGQQYYVYKKRS